MLNKIKITMKSLLDIIDLSYLLLKVSVKCQPLKYTKYDISIFCLPLVSLEMTINL